MARCSLDESQDERGLHGVMDAVHADNAEDIRQLVTFHDDESVFRGSGVARILHRRASILSKSEGSATTYMMSKQVKKIDTFISHNWSVPKLYKYLALSLHFNFSIAILATTMVLAFVSAATAARLLPVLPEKPPMHATGVFCQVVCIPVFLLVLCHGSELLLCLGFEGRTVFLDKTCIHQVNTDLQRRGIEKLGAFLSKSDWMFVIYTDVYLQKLWTVYEVASFLALKSEDRMIMRPTIFIDFMFKGLLFVYLISVINIVLNLYVGFQYGCQLLAPPAMYGWIWLFRNWAREKAVMQARLANFTVDNCICFSEDDRPIVYRNIAKLMRAKGIADGTATDEEALHAFSKSVREVLPGVMTRATGRVVVPYQFPLILAACFEMPELLDEFFGGVAHRVPLRSLLLRALWHSMWMFHTLPLIFAMLEIVSRSCLHVNGWAERLLIGAGILLTIVASLLTTEILDTFTSWSDEDNAGVVAYMFFFSAMSLVVLALHRGWFHLCTSALCAATPFAAKIQATPPVTDNMQSISLPNCEPACATESDVRADEVYDI